MNSDESISHVIYEAERRLTVYEFHLNELEGIDREAASLLDRVRDEAKALGIKVSPPKPPTDPNAVLIDAPEAARLLGISVEALYMRVSRCQVSGVVKTGRRTQFHKERLLSSLEKRARK